MNWMDSYNQANQCVTVESCHILLEDKFVLLASSNKVFNKHLITFWTPVYDLVGVKRLRHYASPKTEATAFCKPVGHCKQLEQFKYLGVVFRSDGKGDQVTQIGIHVW